MMRAVNVWAYQVISLHITSQPLQHQPHRNFPPLLDNRLDRATHPRFRAVSLARMEDCRVSHRDTNPDGVSSSGRRHTGHARVAFNDPAGLLIRLFTSARCTGPSSSGYPNNGMSSYSASGFPQGEPRFPTNGSRYSDCYGRRDWK